MKLEFFVSGVPAPGGSKNGFPFKRADGSLGVRMVDAGKGNAAWKKVVGFIAKSHMTRLRLQPLEGPIRLSAEFLMPRGKTVTRSRHTIAPDLTKLLRSTEDAMTSIVWVDDAQIVEHGTMKKRYALPTEMTGARIVVEVMSEQPTLELPPVSRQATLPIPQPVPEPSPFD